MAFKDPFLLKPFYDSISCGSVRPAQTVFSEFFSCSLAVAAAQSSHTLAFSYCGAHKNGGVRHCLPFPLVILLNERSWKETTGVMFSLCSHPAAACLDCSVFSWKTSHGLCHSLPQRALALLLVELPYLLNWGSEVVYQAEIGNHMTNPSTTGGKGPLMPLQIFSFLFLIEILLWCSHFSKACVFLQTWTYYRN